MGVGRWAMGVMGISPWKGTMGTHSTPIASSPIAHRPSYIAHRLIARVTAELAHGTRSFGTPCY